MSTELKFLFCVDISKDDLIANVSNVMINEEDNTIDLILAII